MAALPTSLDLFGPEQCPISQATQVLSKQGGSEVLGAVYTRAEVVEFMLDLCGYTEDKPLYSKRILEPSFGEGEFLFAIVERLLTSWRASSSPCAVEDLCGAIRAVELHEKSFETTRASLQALLSNSGIEGKHTELLLDSWLVLGDFLLQPFETEFDFVIGNPPYVRQELIPAALLSEYRRRFVTMYDRADLYVPFIEKSLSLLGKQGVQVFICADRWMKNRYGGPLRKMVAQHFHLRAYVDMVDTPAFSSEVTAYPAITVICREPQGCTRIAKRPEISRSALSSLANTLSAAQLAENDNQVRELHRVTNGAEPWLLESFDQMALIQRLESQFPLIEQVGCKIGIGVATGADRAFIGLMSELDVEADRKLPLVTTKDLSSGEVVWRGQGIINPFTDEGALVNLKHYPRLRKYLEDRRDVIAARYCARKSPANWYRTIDRITPSFARQPKLLIPDIKGEAHVVYEAGELYPHHNLYHITSDEWDLKALQAVMLSSIARLFVATYSTKMRGGFLRFQAQYLRRIPVPRWETVGQDLRASLIQAANERNIQTCNQAVFQLYGLTEEERSLVGESGV